MPGEPLRPVDLARLVGVSTQQIRNYVASGVLPPTTRTESGYRRLHARHRQALVAYRALASGYGWPAARQIMQAVHAGDVPRALGLVNAAHADLHEQRLSLQAAGEALEAIAGRPPNDALDDVPVPPSGLRIGDVAGYLGLRASALRVWESAGLLAPPRDPTTGYRIYGPTDVRDARMIHMLRQGRYPLSRIGPILDRLRQAGSTDALRAALAERQAELIHRTAAMLEGASHLHRYLTDHLLTTHPLTEHPARPGPTRTP